MTIMRVHNDKLPAEFGRSFALPDVLHLPSSEGASEIPKALIEQRSTAKATLLSVVRAVDTLRVELEAERGRLSQAIERAGEFGIREQRSKQHAREMGEQIARLKGERTRVLRLLEETRAKLQTQITGLSESLERERDRHAQTQSELLRTCESLSQRCEQIQAMRTRISALEDDVNDAFARCEAVARDADESERRRLHAITELHTVIAERDHLLIRLEQTEMELDTVKADAAQMAEQLAIFVEAESERTRTAARNLAVVLNGIQSGRLWAFKRMVAKILRRPQRGVAAP